jgi:uncharacterized protein YutE (UPF0331/DUF86 family)
MTVSNQFIFEKITLGKQYLSEAMKIFDSCGDKEILESNLHLHTIERYLQLIVDAILDINNHIIKELELESAKDLKSTFSILADNNILDKDFAGQIGKVVGLRNIVVHQYEKVDNKKFLSDFRKHNNDFDEYFKQILSYIDKVSR